MTVNKPHIFADQGNNYHHQCYSAAQENKRAFVMLTLYPEIEPFRSQLLPREPLPDGRRHEIYIEQCGNPDGIPVLFLHGGPGSGCRPQHRSYFDPARYHIILFDQRGCGRSLPAGELTHNDMAHLINDMEAIRELLAIEKWQLFGGSWGATLALCYARQYPQRVLSMILRGTFLGRQQDIDWVYGSGGASNVFADAWQDFIKDVPAAQQQKPLAYYFQQLNDPDPEVQQQTANTLQQWEATIVMMRDTPVYEAPADASPGPLAHSRIQLLFALNQCFIDAQPILADLSMLTDIPTIIIHGRYDMVCPFQQSWLLKQQLPAAELRIVPLAGHAAGEPALIDALVKASDEMANRLA